MNASTIQSILDRFNNILTVLVVNNNIKFHPNHYVRLFDDLSDIDNQVDSFGERWFEFVIFDAILSNWTNHEIMPREERRTMQQMMIFREVCVEILTQSNGIFHEGLPPHLTSFGAFSQHVVTERAPERRKKQMRYLVSYAVTILRHMNRNDLADHIQGLGTVEEMMEASIHALDVTIQMNFADFMRTAFTRAIEASPRSVATENYLRGQDNLPMMPANEAEPVVPDSLERNLAVFDLPM